MLYIGVAVAALLIWLRWRGGRANHLAVSVEEVEVLDVPPAVPVSSLDSLTPGRWNTITTADEAETLRQWIADRAKNGLPVPREAKNSLWRWDDRHLPLELYVRYYGRFPDWMPE